MKRIFFFAVMIAIPLGVLEVASFFISDRYRSDFFSYEGEYFKGVDKGEFDRFVASQYFDSQLGWNNPVSPTKVFRKNCVGETIEYNYRDGGRVTAGVTKGRETAAMFGESYTQGEEVEDASTIASVLSNAHGIPTANYGVNAYDPLQAVLKFRKSLPEMPNLKVAVLLVMHENVWRVVNSFKPVYFPYKSDFYYGLKPYVYHGKIVPLHYPTAFPDFLREAEKRFREDYWSKPERRFPYSVSLARALVSHSAISRFWSKLKGQFVYEYGVNTDSRTAMAAVLEEFVTVANSAHIRPVILFVPRSPKSYGSSREFVRSMNQKWGSEFAYEFVDDGLDWARYRLSEARDYCHPSAYGYARIALFLRNILAAKLPGIAAGIQAR